MGILFNEAMAATNNAASTTHNPMYGTIIMVIGFIAIFYFLIWRPQNKRMKQQRAMLSSLRVGDEVIGLNGMLGKISKLSDTFITLEVAENVEIMVQKSAISVVLPKGTIKTF